MSWRTPMSWRMPVRWRTPLNRLAALRDAPWLNADRATAYGRLLAATMAIALCYSWASDGMGHHPFAPPPLPAQAGKPQPSDFLAFWSAGALARHGHAPLAYDLPSLTALERSTAALDPKVSLAFFYPPPFLLLCLPFALLPYFTAFLAFVAASGAALMLALHRILPPAWGWLPVLAFPGLLMNAATGQNGFVSAACLAWPVLLLETRPFLAGACLGALVIKPHLALCVPVALIAARRWRAVAGAATASIGLILAAWAAFGTATWQAFLHAAPVARDALENHPEDWAKLQTLYTTLRLAGAPLWSAYLGQILLAALVLAVVAALAWRRPGGGAEASLMAAGAVLCAPHVLDYDLAVTGAPLAWLALQSRTGWLPWEKLLMGAAFLWPLVARIATQSAGLPLGPVILLALFALVAGRAYRPHACLAPGLQPA
jgi:alpha-1,2-mannosyltransferase